MNVGDVLAVGGAGCLGAVARFALDGAVRHRVATAVPVGTMAINLSGSLLLGLLTGLVAFHQVPADLNLVAGSGFCGGYTTFSTASFETVRLLQEGRHRAAMMSGAGTALGALAAAAVGLGLAWL